MFPKTDALRLVRCIMITTGVDIFWVTTGVDICSFGYTFAFK